MAKRIKIKGGQPPLGLELTRDEHGVPHVIARDLVAAHWGMGYCHALDRGIQLYLMRVLGQGRAAECLDPSDEMLEVDRFFRRMNWAGRMDGELAKLDGECRGLLESYCDGVNARLSRKRPWELKLVGYRPEPWRIEDTLLLARMIGYLTLAQSQAEMERLLVELVQAGVDDEKLETLFPGILAGLDRELVGRVRLGDRVVPDRLKWLSGAPRMMASNNWVVAASRSVTGHTLMSNDPHLEINRLPAVWVEQVIELPDRCWIAANMPGLPAPLIGRTAELAWGATYTFMDAVDSWVEDCKGGMFRRGEEGWEPFTMREEVIKRKKGEPVTVRFYENQHGVLDGDPKEEGHYLCTRWAPSLSGGESLMAVKDLWAARTVEDGMAALGRIESSWNWVLADSGGNIGYQMSGLMPRRHPEATGFVPMPGWMPEFDWQGTVPVSELPRCVNPPEGFIVTANQDLNHLGRARPINLPMGDYRARRIARELATTERIGWEDCARLQMDTYSLQAEELLAAFEPHLTDGGVGGLLKGWDRRYDLDSKGAVAFEELYWAFVRELLEPSLGSEVVEHLLGATGVFIDFYQNLDRLILADTSPWHDGRDRAALLAAALARVSEPVKDTWGDRNLLRMSHLLFGGKMPRFLGFDRGPFPLPGGRATPHQGQLYESAGRQTSFAPSIRLIADLGEDFMRTCLCGGPRDRRFSPYYASEIPAWREGRYKKLGRLSERQ
ncbi:MAG: penicillin acylase family protein [Polyangia bacterium]|jgi:penicillin amidase|nr:penicillin acylase family protein [Polyangia bacterium]